MEDFDQYYSRQASSLGRGLTTSENRPSLSALENAYSEKRMAQAKKAVAKAKKQEEFMNKKGGHGVSFGPPFGYYMSKDKEGHTKRSVSNMSSRTPTASVTSRSINTRRQP